MEALKKVVTGRDWLNTLASLAFFGSGYLVALGRRMTGIGVAFIGLAIILVEVKMNEKRTNELKLEAYAQGIAHAQRRNASR